MEQHAYHVAASLRIHCWARMLRGLAGGFMLEGLQLSSLFCAMQVLPYVKTLHAGPGMSGSGSPKLQPAA